MLSRFLRSAIHTTDSTLMGCRANSAATMKLRPARPGRLQQDPEQQHYIERMQQYIGAVMASRIELKELPVQSVRKPGHGMPIGLIVGGESPRDRVPGEPRLNVVVLGDIAVVVVIDERVMNRRVVKSRGGDYEDKAENQGTLRWLSEQALCRLRRSPLFGSFANMLGFQTSRSHSSPVFDEYIRWRLIALNFAARWVLAVGPAWKDPGILNRNNGLC